MGKESNKSASLFNQVRKNGFTLIEALLSLLAVTSIFSLLPLALQVEYKIIQASEVATSAEWHLFLKQLQEEKGDHAISTIHPDGFCFVKDEKKVCYSKYHSLIRKQVDGRGHEPILTNIQSFQTKASTNELEIIVESKAKHLLQTKIPLHGDVKNE
ncbi:competence type IV pilus minor pilin ComGF [Listeria kieliensis]|uniref:competence type IV pilus minor pilin ComGF n=1 Tax=Listeria kieliensis TaxID=1621700 RepID=UPI000E211F13|nr:competence type IV pilus minor pilin ComGF [Listeria kieliensis]